ncbi:MAG: hypothetical protein HOW73_33945 [Polyangiaceae bacterium]|nr:hypothetical protein [Polyangiaceae bacterium]
MALGAGCVDDSEIDDEIDDEIAVEVETQGVQNQLPPCYEGISTSLHVIDASAPRCTLADVPAFRDHVTSGPLELKAFVAYLNGHATLQCHPYVAEDGTDAFCVDVVDRYGDNSTLEKGQLGVDSRNFFIAYADDQPRSAEIQYWDTALGTGTFTNAPVSLSEAGYVRETGDVVHAEDGRPSDPAFRLLKFDPRTCPSCGIYNGPNMEYVSNPLQLQTWFPVFIEEDCTFQPTSTALPADYVKLDGRACMAELTYRSTGR